MTEVDLFGENRYFGGPKADPKSSIEKSSDGQLLNITTGDKNNSSQQTVVKKSHEMDDVEKYIA